MRHELRQACGNKKKLSRNPSVINSLHRVRRQRCTDFSLSRGRGEEFVYHSTHVFALDGYSSAPSRYCMGTPSRTALHRSIGDHKAGASCGNVFATRAPRARFSMLPLLVHQSSHLSGPDPAPALFTQELASTYKVLTRFLLLRRSNLQQHCSLPAGQGAHLLPSCCAFPLGLPFHLSGRPIESKGEKPPPAMHPSPDTTVEPHFYGLPALCPALSLRVCLCVPPAARGGSPNFRTGTEISHRQ